VGGVQQSQVGAHNHPLSGNVGVESEHVHDKGSMNITGAFGSDWTYTDGAFYYDSTEHSADNNAGGSKDNTIRFEASRSWTGVTSGPKTLVSGNYEAGHTHSMNGLSTSNNTTDSTNENRVSSMLMVPIIKW
jgi:hypothetical protein